MRWQWKQRSECCKEDQTVLAGSEPGEWHQEAREAGAPGSERRQGNGSSSTASEGPVKLSGLLSYNITGKLICILLIKATEFAVLFKAAIGKPQSCGDEVP